MSAAQELEEEDVASGDSLRRGARARILVVDDDGEMLRIVGDTLRQDGHEVRQLASAPALLDILVRIEASAFPLDGVDLLVLDHRMPQMTGLHAVRTIRDSACVTPVVLMTAYPDARVEAEALELDVTVLSKPFTREVLRRTVISKLRGRRTSG